MVYIFVFRAFLFAYRKVLLILICMMLSVQEDEEQQQQQKTVHNRSMFYVS